MEKILIFQWFKCSDIERESELIECITHNLAIGFDRVIIFNDSVEPKFFGNNIENVRITRRMRYSDYMSVVCDSSNFGNLVVLTNTDIKLDKNILNLPLYIKEKNLIAISRYESDVELAKSHWCTQDVWAIISQPVHVSVGYQSDIPLGVPGCENRFAEIFHGAGYAVFNPCLEIKNLHVHSKQKAYAQDFRVYGSYLFVHSCKLIDIETNNKNNINNSNLVYLSSSNFGEINFT
jgi:hypothetical protein